MLERFALSYGNNSNFVIPLSMGRYLIEKDNLSLVLSDFKCFWTIKWACVCQYKCKKNDN